jgi:hypothetical protein
MQLALYFDRRSESSIATAWIVGRFLVLSFMAV